MGERQLVVHSIKISYLFTWVVYTLMVCFLYPLRYELPKIFTSNSDVTNLVGDLSPLLILFLFFDSHSNLLCGVLQGCGRQWFTTVATIVGFYLTGLPMGVILMFKTSLGVAGLLWGLVLAGFIGTLMAAVAVFKTDWDKEIRRAQIRAGVHSYQSEQENEGLLTKKKRGKICGVLSRCLAYCRSDDNPQDNDRHWLRDRLVYVAIMLTFLAIGVVVRVCDFIPGTPGYYPNATLIHTVNATI